MIQVICHSQSIQLLIGTRYFVSNRYTEKREVLHIFIVCMKDASSSSFKRFRIAIRIFGHTLDNKHSVTQSLTNQFFLHDNSNTKLSVYYFFACMIRCMNVDKARGVCKDRSRWRSVVSAYPHGKKAWVYVCMVYARNFFLYHGWVYKYTQTARPGAITCRPDKYLLRAGIEPKTRSETANRSPTDIDFYAFLYLYILFVEGDSCGTS